MEGQKKNVNIWKSLQKVPAGTMFVPLIIGAIITTVCEGFFNFDLWGTLGNPMKDMFSSSGQMLIIGLMLFCTGTQLKLSDFRDALHRGILLIIVRLVICYALCALYYFAFGQEGILGIPFLAVVCALSSANAALYMGNISSFGDKSDKASFGIMLMCSMPLLPMLFLGFFGTSGFGMSQVMQIISLLIPFVLGVFLGNIDMDIRKVFAGGNAIVMPFMGFEFGSTINLIDAVKELPQGLLLSIVYFIVVIIPSYIFERKVLHRPGYASVASGSLAGVALSIPSMAAAANADFTPYVDVSVAILAFVLAVTNIVDPFLVKREIKRHPVNNPPESM